MREPASPDSTLLTLDDVHVRFAGQANWRGRPRDFVHAVNGVDLHVGCGETLGIVGESGCGKSTLGQAIMGLVPVQGGRVSFADQDLALLDRVALQKIRRGFQIVFQDPQSSLDPRLRVWQIIAEPIEINERISAAARRARAEALAEKVGLRREMLDRHPHEFSGGQRQRIAIARALALQPELLVLDEPTSALDISVQAQILNLLMELQAELGLAYILISHDIAVIRHVSDRVAVMYLGQIVELGSADEVLSSPAHPYTRALLSSVPRLARDAASFEVPAQAELPSNRQLPAGCFFRARCPFAAKGCDQPQVLTKANGREVRCHLSATLPPRQD